MEELIIITETDRDECGCPKSGCSGVARQTATSDNGRVMRWLCYGCECEFISVMEAAVGDTVVADLSDGTKVDGQVQKHIFCL